MAACLVWSLLCTVGPNARAPKLAGVERIIAPDFMLKKFAMAPSDVYSKTNKLATGFTTRLLPATLAEALAFTGRAVRI